MTLTKYSVIAVLLLALAQPFDAAHAQSQQQPSCRTFNETGKTVCGRFLEYWNTHGGLAQQGFPISVSRSEVSDTNGKVYTVQYFERAVFELHSENRPPNDVLLSLLGVFLYGQKYPEGASSQLANSTPGSVVFPATGKRLGGLFLAYWQKNGALAQQGYPISDEFTEKSDLNGKIYRVQYFERAVFEWHPEYKPPYDVLLSQLGTFRYRAKYAGATECDISGNRDGAAEPSILKLGNSVRIYAWGFTPPEPVAWQVNKPDGTVVSSRALGITLTAQYRQFDFPFTLAESESPGRYFVTIEGQTSKHKSVIYVCAVK